MATTILQVFEGETTLDSDKIETLKAWYKGVQGDCDKATDVDDASYYQGGVDMVVGVLRLLYNMPQDDVDNYHCPECGTANQWHLAACSKATEENTAWIVNPDGTKEQVK